LKMRIASLSLLTVCCLLLAVAPVMADTLYSNGPYNGNIDAWAINFGFSVSDSFILAPDPHVKSLDFVYWDASSTDILTTVDMAIGSTSFGGAPQRRGITLGVGTNTFLGTNTFGFSLYQADFSSFDIPWSGAGFLTLSNACTTSGCSVSTEIFWDQNNGPSTAYENTLGSIPSEAFTLGGTTDTTTPEPSSIMLFGSGILGVFGVLRRRLIG
jgi:PEP-CTERM motif